jgi:superfamily I DNA and/or RNA helicase
LREQWAEELDELLQKVQRLKQEARSLEQGAWEALIGSARVVGCTTTGAAKHKQLLQGSNAPRVVMVEEAAEILEAHVLTSLSPRTRHLVMIGDHKQLRPKVENAKLKMRVSCRTASRSSAWAKLDGGVAAQHHVAQRGPS